MPQALPWGFTLFSAKLCHAVPKGAASYCAVLLCTAQALLLLFELCPYCSLLPPGLVLRYDTLGCVVLKHAEHCYAEFRLDPALYEGQARPTVPKIPLPCPRRLSLLPTKLNCFIKRNICQTSSLLPTQFRETYLPISPSLAGLDKMVVTVITDHRKF